jgi:hypothetical protein
LVAATPIQDIVQIAQNAVEFADEKYADVDFMGSATQSKGIKKLSIQPGYAPRKFSTLCKEPGD